MKIFPRLINAILAHTGESRATLCKRTGISKTSLNDFLGGRKDLSFDAVIALVAAFPRYNARWLLTGAKSQAMLEHQAKLDAAKPVALPPAIYPSDDVVIERLQKFADNNNLGLYVSNEEATPNPYAQLCDGDIDSNGITQCTQADGITPKQAALNLAKALSSQAIRAYGDPTIIRAPDFFQPLQEKQDGL